MHYRLMPNGLVADVKVLVNWLSTVLIVKDTVRSIAQLVAAMVFGTVAIVAVAVLLDVTIAMAEEL